MNSDSQEVNNRSLSAAGIRASYIQCIEKNREDPEMSVTGSIGVVRPGGRASYDDEKEGN
jgi:hypothetical protein